MKHLIQISFAVLLVLCCAALLAQAAPAHDGENHEHGLVVAGAWAPHTGRRTVSAAVYLSVKNTGKENDTLLGIETSAAAMAMLHQSKEEGGLIRMLHVEALSIKAGEAVALAPGGYHIMLTRLEQPLKRGDVFTLNLAFEKAGIVPVIVEITGIGGPIQRGG